MHKGGHRDAQRITEFYFVGVLRTNDLAEHHGINELFEKVAFYLVSGHKRDACAS